MDVRPQSHEIIRTWAFYTIVKAWMHSDDIPWRHVVISGWILDPDRKKMSKSKGNVVTPEGLLDEWTADGVRYWAARARLGTDTALRPGRLQGRQAARQQGLQRQPVRADAARQGRRRRADPSRRRAHHRAPRPGFRRAPARRSSSKATAGVRRFRLRHCPAGRRGRFLAVSATITSSSSSCAPTTRTTPPSGARRWRPCSGACAPSCGCSLRSCPSSPKRCGRGGSPPTRVESDPSTPRAWPSVDEVEAVARAAHEDVYGSPSSCWRRSAAPRRLRRRACGGRWRRSRSSVPQQLRTALDTGARRRPARRQRRGGRHHHCRRCGPRRAAFHDHRRARRNRRLSGTGLLTTEERRSCAGPPGAWQQVMNHRPTRARS